MAVFGRVMAWVLRPTWAMLGGALVPVLVFVGLLVLPSSYQFERLLRPLLDRSRPEPEPIYLFRRLTALLDARGDPRPSVAFVGGSTMRESILGEAHVARRLRDLGGGDVEVADLTSSAQTLMWSQTLAELAACRGDARIVAVGVNIGRMSRVSDDPGYRSFGYLAPSAETGLSGRMSGLVDMLRGQVAFRAALLPVTIAHALRLKKAYGRHRYIGMPPGRFRNAERMAAAVASFIAPKDPRAYAILTRIRSTVEACGARAVFVNTSMLPSLRGSGHAELDAAQRRHLADIRAAIGPAGSLIDLDARVVHTDADFADWGHLANADAIRRASDALAEALTPTLRALHAGASR